MNIESLLALPLSSLASLRLSRGDRLGTIVAAACLLEASSVKAGNVHPQANFDNMDYSHFQLSAEVVGKTVDQIMFSPTQIDPSKNITSVGDCILQMAVATKQRVEVNTNLGTLILLGPLLVATQKLAPKIVDEKELQRSVAHVLSNLTTTDSEGVYQSIQVANPGGLGASNQMDVNKQAPTNILEAMRFAQHKDDVAKQWVTNFETVFSLARRLRELVDSQTSTSRNWLEAISLIQIEYLAVNVDSLIARKNSLDLANEVQRRADQLLSIRSTSSSDYHQQWIEFDAFLRADGNRRNPGTTADLLAAALYVTIVCEASFVQVQSEISLERGREVDQ
ncbi:MAG: triphosphoribosyl-dephospho-CoA synthase [Planctomycetota bacterium]|nr:triphosphoribosyl-dephospho-CoA synthase [Planctomycetota bacterium]